MPRNAAPVAAVTSSSVPGAVGSHSTTDEAAAISRTARVSVSRAAYRSVWPASSWATLESVLRSAACSAARLSASRRCRNWVTCPPMPSSRRTRPGSGSRGVRETSTTTPTGEPAARSGSAAVEQIPSSTASGRRTSVASPCASDLHSGTRDIQLWPGKPSPTS